MSIFVTGRRNARFATLERIWFAQASSLNTGWGARPAEAFAEGEAEAGLQTNSFCRVGVSLTPVTLKGPSIIPLRNRGSPAGLCASWLAR